MKNTISSRFKLLTTSLNSIATKQNNSWKWVTQNDLHKRISGAVNILKKHNIESGDRVLYKGSNSVEYVSWNLATNSLGAIWVPTSKEQSLSSINHIINDCNPKLYISDENNVDSIDNKIKPSDKDYNIHTNDWDLSTLIYTSGTSGAPKGVTLTNANILANIDSISRRFSDHNNQRMTSLNLLPWSHIFSLTTELYYNLLNNNAVAICEDKTKFAKNLKEINPEYIYVVPKVLKLIKDKCKHLEKFPFSNTIIPKALDYIFGGNIKTIFIGGAKLDADVATFFEKHGFNPCEGYGSTETSPVVAVNHNIKPRDINSVGKILDNVEVKIHNDEILVSGPTVMAGYWGNLAATNKALVQMDNKIWYKTGDSGYVCEDNFLYYTGRMSDNYKLSNGKFVDVHVVETEVRKYVPEGNFIVWGNGLDFNVLITDVHVSKNTLHNINEGLDTFMKIKKIITTDTQQFESAMTQKLSIKRQQLVNQLNHPLLTQSTSKEYTKLK
jgi:long-subunit acyl-CoA synthetase (AMP-forming)